MADRFRALNRRGTVNFECWFNRVRNPGRTWIVPDFGFEHAFVPSIPLTAGRVGFPWRHYCAANPRIIVTFHADLAVAPSVLHGFRRDRTLAYYVEKTFEEWIPRTRAREVAKRRLFANADAFLSPGADADEYIRRYRSDAHIHRLAPPLQTGHFGDAIRMRGAPDAAKRRHDLGLTGFVFMNVGRMWWQKGIGTLLDAYVDVRARGVSASLLLVGDGQDRDAYVSRVQTEQIPDVHFVDFVQQTDLPRWYALGDAFVFPTRGDPYGLVVDEAMASGLPIVSTDHAGEVGQRVIQGVSGSIVPIDDATALADAMTELAHDPARAQAMGEQSRRLIMGRTLDAWVDSIEEFVATALHPSRSA